MVEYAVEMMFYTYLPGVMLSRRLETRLLVFLALMGFLIPVPPHNHAGAQKDGDHQHASGSSQHYHVDGPHETGNRNTGHPHTSTSEQDVRIDSHSISSSQTSSITVTDRPELELSKPVLFLWNQPQIRRTSTEAVQPRPPFASSRGSSHDVILLTRTFLL